MADFDDIYATLLGEMEDYAAVPGVEDAFRPGSVCDQAYGQIMDAYERLRQRLGAEDEDADVEVILNACSTIQQELCRRMFFYGSMFRSQS